MADLAAIKADLKTWERAFKAREGREPRKDDIKLVPDIAEKYKIYNKSRKAPSSSSAQQPNASSSSRRAPPSTGDPVKPSSSTRHSSPPAPSAAPKAVSSLTPSKAGAFASTGAKGQQLFSPVKRSPANNPFLVSSSPAKRSPLNPTTASSSSTPFLSRAVAASAEVGTPKKKAAAAAGAPGTPGKSPGKTTAYHNPLSPAKLAALISAHSTTGAPNDVASLRAASAAGGSEGWTPRTKARKRLNGELGQGNTPVKRRRSGGASPSGEDAPTGKDAARASVVKAEEEEGEVVIGPTPLKPSDRSRRVLPSVARDGEDDVSSSDDDDDVRGTTSQDKLRGPQSNGKPRVLFAGGKAGLMSASDAAQSESSSAKTTIHPFFSRAAVPPPTVTAKQVNAIASSSRAPSPALEAPADAPQKARAASPPSTSTTTKPPPTKRARKAPAPSFGKVNMTAAAKAKAEQAASRLQEGGDGSDDSGDEALLRRVVQSHTLGRAAHSARPRHTADQGRLARARSAAPQDDDDMAAIDDPDAADPQLDPADDDAWASDLDDDLLEPRLRPSPRKKAGTLYGLPQAFSADDDEEPHTLVEDSDDGSEVDADGLDVEETETGRAVRRSTKREEREAQDLPPHLLALLSLRSPQIASAKTAKRNENTFHAIFAHARPVEEAEEPPAVLVNPKPQYQRRRPTKRMRGSVVPPPSPPLAAPAPPPASALDQPRREKKVRGEVWGLGDVGGGEMDEIEMKDDEWDSEPEGWKAVGDDDNDDW